MMKNTSHVIAFVALHYGTDYLKWAIRSVIDHVDKVYIAYSSHGSHGSQTEVSCPDTRAELLMIAQYAAKEKLHWYEGDWCQENEQRNSIYAEAPDADMILVLDSDEIWRRDMVERVLRTAWQGDKRFYRCHGIHFWRSLWKAVANDYAAPERVICPKRPEGMHILDAYFAHLGYAQRPEIVEYKQRIHGHKNEWRKDCDWYQDIFMRNRLTDCHPTNLNYWSPVSIDPLRYLPAMMSDHPYFEKAVIE